MFSYFSQVKTKGKNFLFAVLVLVLLTAIMGGCKTDADDSGNLNGTWLAYDSYIINATTSTIEHVGNYKAEIVNSPNYEAASGVLIIKFTWYYETVYNWEPPYDIISEGERTDYIDQYGAVYWKNLKAGSVQMGDAYDMTTWEPAMYDTLPAAETNFTFDRYGDYISQWGAYTK